MPVITVGIPHCSAWFVGAAAAQCVIFGLCGVDVALDGAVTFNPQPEGLADSLSLTGLQLRGRSWTCTLIMANTLCT